MKRFFILTFSLLCVSLPCAAQEPPSEIFLSLGGPGGGYARKLMPMGNTVNNNIDLFYEDRDTNDWTDPYPIVFRTIGPTGARGPIITLATDVEPTYWKVVWHPKIGRYLLVYRQDNLLYAMSVMPNGNHLPARLIGSYSGNWFDLCWTKKKKFILFLSRNNKPVGQALRMNGKKFRGEKNITDSQPQHIDFGNSSTQNDGTAVFYYGIYDYSTKKTTFRMVRMDHKLVIKNDNEILGPTSGQLYPMGMYDPFNRHHGVVWFDSGRLWFFTVNNRCELVSSPKNYYTDKLYVSGLRFDRPKKQFAVWYYTWAVDNINFREIDYHFFYRFKSDGTVIAEAEPIKTLSVNNEIDSRGLGIARNGNVLLCWSHEDYGSGERGTYGWLIY